MRVKVKNFEGIQEVEVSSTDPVSSIKHSISADVQKLSHGLRLLKDNVTFQDAGINDGDVIVALPSRKIRKVMIDSTSVHELEAAEEALIPTRNIIMQYTSSNSPSSRARRRSNPLSYDASTPIGQLRNQLQDLVGSLIGIPGSTFNIDPQMDDEEDEESVEPSQESATSGGVDGATTEENQATVTITVDASALQALQEMGFQEERAKKALILNRMNPEMAMEWLLEHETDADIDEPLTQQQLTAIGNRSAQSSLRILNNRGTANPPSNAPFVPDANAIQKLKDMGFNEDDIVEALRVTNNNQEAACAWLLGDREAEESGNVLQAILTNPQVQAGLANPRVLQALRAVLENPSAALQYLADPEIGPILLQVHNIIQNSQ